jgi:uncharacterized protein YutE (UPF0331/DUF86 family)
MINKNIVNNKLKNLTLYLKELKPFLKIDSRVLLEEKNYRDLRALEREFQLIVDTMIEINSHFISKLNLPAPDDYANTFVTLGQNKVLPSDFAFKIAQVVGLRNKIVHKYDVIDLKRFIDDLKANSVQFEHYLKYIATYLKK